ncbi:hypothetical protein M422DRAFT_30733 [Sphaerobolus stellatus SS14]|uniref:Protein kinase domain-containing protein n=1 Tax=Sphaerobolus stellatus (strain SS14) TaxID=990650 RepID=A0A0C9ULP8_SPHS4|nr:hypothetical protein M422DRAFT_30733 [Sphaerobolus stellatus SS14]
MSTEGGPILTKEDLDKEIDEGLKTEDARDHRKLNPVERFWAKLQPWFESRGYMLRPRYRPGWVPSWEETDERASLDSEDWISVNTAKTMDAVRIRDNYPVMLKAIWTHVHPYEVEIAQYLSSQELRSDPTNHCVPVLDVLHCSTYQNLTFIVMPLLRWFENPRMATVGEAVDFFRQLFEGLQFMHKHRIAHRDCAAQNIRMDASAMYPKGFHAQRPWVLPEPGLPVAPWYHRTERPPKYYLIDFGISRRYNPGNGEPLEPVILGGDRTVPEFQGEGKYSPWNPFPTDIYYIGNVIKIDYLERYTNFKFMQELVDDMRQEDPSKRPTIDEVVNRMEGIIRSLSIFKLRSYLIERDMTPAEKCQDIAGNFFRQIFWVVRLLPAIPSYRKKKS